MFAGVEQRIAARYEQSAWRRQEAARQALARASDVVTGTGGARWGLGRLREAWVVFRHGVEVRQGFAAPVSGPELVADHGAGGAGPRRPGQLRRAAGAIALYESFAEQRPPGWPASGAGALCALAAQRRATTFEGEIARLRCLAKDMRASARTADPDRLTQLRARAERRRGSGLATGLAFRVAERLGPRWETGEQRRLRLRDELLLAGQNPGLWPNAALVVEQLGLRAPELVGADGYEALDGVHARADRYAQGLRAGRWALPPCVERASTDAARHGPGADPVAPDRAESQRKGGEGPAADA